MKVTRKIIKIDEDLCNGCGQCIITCAEGALEIIDGKAKLVADKYCDGLGACLGDCPQGALKIVERTAEDFDEEAVHERLDQLKQTVETGKESMPCGCPSTMLESFAPQTTCQKANEPVSHVDQASALSHWPVQIRLVPSSAPFLKNADLVVAADCTPIAYPNFHRDFLTGKVVMIGCPKFDDVQSYIEKFSEIFSNASVKSVSVVIMEVPCCGGLPMIVKRGMEMAGKTVPLELIMVSTRGEILKKEKLVA